ncbi:MAG: PQQ-binding-like beta-propeller repeat protein [Phycisphaerales bacterium]
MKNPVASPLRTALVGTALCLALIVGPALAQPAGGLENPVFVNESLAAGEALARARENLASGNIDQAVRLVQRVLDDDAAGAGGIVQSTSDATLYVPIREAVHRFLLADAALLERYRASQERQANEDLRAGRFVLVERGRLLTRAGALAALRVAGEQVEASQFWAAWHTLLQLEAHPDCVAGGPPQPDAARADSATANAARRAAELAVQVARYLDSPVVSRHALAWAQRAGFNQTEVHAVRGPHGPAVVSPLGAQGEAALDGLVSRPVASVQFGRRDSSEVLRPGARANNPEFLPPSGRDLRTMPALSGDTVVLSSPRGIFAFDRLTLMPRWQVEAGRLLGLEGEPDEPDAGQGRGRMNFRTWEDVASVAVRGPWVVATASGDSRDEEQDLVAAIDGASGKVRWTRWSGQIDPQLARARVRGPIALEGDLAVVSFRKELRERRLGAALYLAGISLEDGSTRWTSLVGSIGALPFQRSSPVTDGGLIVDGVYLRSDRMGLLAAYIAGTGRPLWVRRFTGEAADAGQSASSWQTQIPVILNGRAIVLTPDRRQVVAVDLVGGGVSWRLDDQRLGTPAYLLGAGETLALVGEDAVVLLNAADPRAAAPVVATFDPPGIRGRVVVAGRRLLVPLAAGVAAVDPRLPASERGSAALPAFTPIDDSGSLVADGGQLLVADDSRLHNYLSWEAGDRLLTDRIESSPRDASAAIALAEFAYRAGRNERVLFAADAAVAAIRSGALSAADLAETVEPDRRRLLAALRRMIATTLRDASGATEEAGGPEAIGVLPPALLMGVLERYGAMARTSEETVAHRLYLGRAHERAARFGDAVAAYQGVLASADLSAAMWQGERLGVRADAQATRRLEALVAARGRSVYADVEREFAAALGAVPPAAGPGEIEQLARRYPVAVGTPGLWLRIALLYSASERPRAAARALEIGLQTAQHIPDPLPVVVGELAGELVMNLTGRSLFAAAAETLSEVQARFPAVQLARTGGVPIDTQALAAELGRQVALAHRWPGVGAPRAEGVEVFAGWTILEPAIRPMLGVAPAALMMRHDDGRVMLVAAKEPDAPLTEVWSAQPEAEATELVRLDNTAAMLFMDTPAGGVLQRIETAAGIVAWRTRPFNTHFEGPPGGGVIAPGAAGGAVQPEGGAGRPVDRVQTPLEGVRRATELLVCTDDRTLVLVERTGRAGAFDADAGSTLWAAGLPIARVFDCDVAGSTLAIVGERDLRRADGSVSATVPVLLVVDARSGRVVHEVEPPPGQVRWLRLSNRGDLVLGCALGLCAIDAETGQVLWVNTDPLASGTLRAWALGQSLLLVASDRTLWSVSFTSGVARPVSARGEDGARLETSSEPQAYAVDNGGLALCSPKGLFLIDRDGNIVGGDALAADDTLVGPVPGEGIVATIDSGLASRAPVNEMGLVYPLHLMESGTGRLLSSTPLLLGEPPARLSLMPGRIALTAGRTTLVYRAPQAQP